MFNPESKNWIKKYFSLVENNIITLDINPLVLNDVEKKSLHILELSENTGLIYGASNKLIFTQHLNLKITKEERLKLLLFESLIFIYRLHNTSTFDAQKFLMCLVQFYDLKFDLYGHRWYYFLPKKDASNNLENLLTKRIKVKSSYSQTNYWFNHLSNSLLFIDLILFHSFCAHQKPTFEEHYDPYTQTILTFIFGKTNSIDPIHPDFIDRRILKNLILSSGLEDSISDLLTNTNEKDEHFLEAEKFLKTHPMLASFAFHLLVFVNNPMPTENYNSESYLYKSAVELGLSIQDAESIYWECRKSLSEYSPEFSDLISDSESKILFNHLSKKYSRILGRNKDKFILELRESKELVELVRKSTKEELSQSEKELVKRQFLDLMKTVPSIGIFLIPGGSLLLPLILKLIPDLMPSAFKDNEIKKR